MGDNKYLVRVTGIFVILGAILAIPLLNHLLFTPLFGPLIALAAAALIYLLLTENRTSVTGEVYALRLGKANAALLIFTFGWPFLLFGLYKLVSPGRDIPFGFIATTIVKPYVYLFYVIAVLSVTKKRLRSLNLDSSWLVVLAFPMFSSVVFWLAASAPWSVSFALGAVGGIPDVLLAIYTVLIALCLAAPAGSNIETRQREVLNSPLRHFCSVLLLTIVIYHVANDIVRTTSNYELWSVFSRIGSYLAPLSAAFRLAAIALCYQLWVAAGRPGEHPSVKVRSCIGRCAYSR